MSALAETTTANFFRLFNQGGREGHGSSAAERRQAFPRSATTGGECDPERAAESPAALLDPGRKRRGAHAGRLRSGPPSAAARSGLATLDGVIVTHDHGDHCHGIDELRPVSQRLAVRCRFMAEPTSSRACERASTMPSSNRIFTGRSSKPREIGEDDKGSVGARCASSINRMAARLRSACASMKAIIPSFMR